MQYLTIDDLMTRYQKNRVTIYRWRKKLVNPFPAPKIQQKGITCLWSPDDVEKWENTQS